MTIDRRMALGTLLALSVALAASALDNGGAAARTPGVWSPTDSDLVFMSNHEGNGEIYLLPAGMTEWINLTRHPAGDNWPEWSPDGSRIAFQSDRGGNLDIFLMDADGSNPVQLTDDPAHDYLPTWTPDGDHLYFASWRAEPGDGDEPAVHVYRMNADGSEALRVFAESPGTSTTPMPSPDGSAMAMARKPGEQKQDLFLVDGMGSILRQLTDDGTANGGASFSPDGQWLAFHADRGDISTLEIIHPDGTGRRTILDDGARNWGPRFAAAGDWVVYTTAAIPDNDADLDIRAVPLDGSSPPITLAGGPGRQAEGRWRPGR